MAHHDAGRCRDDRIDAGGRRRDNREGTCLRRGPYRGRVQLGELDRLFQRVYEDNISGKLTDERFSKLSAAYEEEQHTLTANVKILKAELDKEQEQAVSVAQFVALVKRYTDLQELTPSILNEFIERITVSAPDKSSGHRVQKIHI